VKTFLDIYDDLRTRLVSHPVRERPKTEHEKFAGALATIPIEALMHDGKALQAAPRTY
jgi:prolyl-tRNA synthetase